MLRQPTPKRVAVPRVRHVAMLVTLFLHWRRQGMPPDPQRGVAKASDQDAELAGVPTT